MITLHVSKDQAETLAMACRLLGEVSKGTVSRLQQAGHDHEAGGVNAKLTDLATMASRLRYAKDDDTLWLANA